MFEDYQKTLVKASLKIDKHPELILSPGSNKSIAAITDNSLPVIESPDLFFVKFVLASEHENSNGDYFSRSELISAQNSPRHKPFNIEHTISETASYITAPLYNETKNTIIGHIVGSALAKKDGTILTAKEVKELDQTDDPSRPHDDSLDLVASAVLYSFYFPETVADIDRMSEEGNLAVSMEAWFKGYDFMVDSEIVEATQDNKVQLTNDWHNRKEVGGRRVSRVLKSVLFGGVAGTENPANEESVFITANMNKELDKLKTRHEELHILFEANPCDKYINEHIELVKTAASIQKQLNSQQNKGE